MISMFTLCKSFFTITHFVLHFAHYRIEKSRVVVPTLLEAMKKKTKLSTVKWNEAYRLLFTLENLKLVQIGCHKKASRIGNKCCIEDFIL